MKVTGNAETDHSNIHKISQSAKIPWPQIHVPIYRKTKLCCIINVTTSGEFSLKTKKFTIFFHSKIKTSLYFDTKLLKAVCSLSNL